MTRSTALEPFLRDTAFLNFIQSLNTICVSTCFLQRQDLLSFSLAGCTKNGFRLSNLRCLIFAFGYYAWNSKNTSVCVFSSTCFACSMCCFLPVLFLITSFLSPVGLLASNDQKLQMSCLCSVLIASPLVFLSRSSQLFFSPDKIFALSRIPVLRLLRPTFISLERDLHALHSETFFPNARLLKVE